MLARWKHGGESGASCAWMGQQLPLSNRSPVRHTRGIACTSSDTGRDTRATAQSSQRWLAQKHTCAQGITWRFTSEARKEESLVPQPYIQWSAALIQYRIDQSRTVLPIHLSMYDSGLKLLRFPAAGGWHPPPDPRDWETIPLRTHSQQIIGHYVHLQPVYTIATPPLRELGLER